MITFVRVKQKRNANVMFFEISLNKLHITLNIHNNKHLQSSKWRIYLQNILNSNTTILLQLVTQNCTTFCTQSMKSLYETAIAEVMNHP